jgi:hypothetical protein
MPQLPHPDGAELTCAGKASTGCTGATASAWSGCAGFRYCKSGACRALGKERGHIQERGEQSGGSSKRPRVCEESSEAAPTTTPESEWWPTGIDYISAVQCAPALIEPPRVQPLSALLSHRRAPHLPAQAHTDAASDLH